MVCGPCHCDAMHWMPKTIKALLLVSQNTQFYTTKHSMAILLIFLIKLHYVCCSYIAIPMCSAVCMHGWTIFASSLSIRADAALLMRHRVWVPQLAAPSP